MKKTLLIVATASSMLMGSMLAQAGDDVAQDDIKNYVLELDTSGMTPEEIENTRGELRAKYSTFFGKRIKIGVEIGKGTRRNKQGHLETYYFNR